MKLYIGENLKKLREEKKVTQDTLAEYLGVTYQAVSRWENGLAYPDIELLPEIARFFEVSLEELMGCGNGEKETVDKAIEIANRRFYRYNDPKELLRELHELERQFPNNWEITHRYMWNLIGGNADNDPTVLLEHKDELN
ncbi:MAG: helix-turn-helix transcriptional regulator, partial [Clostridia bacterium]|nr:helix-turn-helix transcriptional regulator [Clostridia bacterium]